MNINEEVLSNLKKIISNQIIIIKNNNCNRINSKNNLKTISQYHFQIQLAYKHIK